MKRSGRRPGKPDTREHILAAARSLFASQGFDRASVRRIAAEADVDPALVHHYFGSKSELFLAAIDVPLDPAEIVKQVTEPGIEGFGERLVHAFITVWDSPAGDRLVALFRSAAAEEESATLLKNLFETRILSTVQGAFGEDFDHPQLRANLVASQLFGLASTRYLLKLDPIAHMHIADLVGLLGPTLQRYITMDLTEIEV